MPGPNGKQVTLTHAAKYSGKVLSDDAGWKHNKGECATGVQYVFAKAGVPLGFTKTWKKGKLVKGNSVLPGTAIASFQGDQYKNDHAAILISESAAGLEVWDQYNHPPKPWGKRTLAFMNNNDRSNNGNLFYVIDVP